MTGLRPLLRPRTVAAARPARVRSWIRSRSNWPSAPKDEPPAGRGGVKGLGQQAVDQNVEHDPILVDGPPEPVLLSPDHQAHLASRAGESHPHALPEPYVTLSRHTAPDVRPFPCRKRQCANRCRLARMTRASQSLAPLGR